MNNRNIDPFDERFEKMWDRHDKIFDSAFDKPGRTFFKFGLIAVLLNLLLWGGIIALIVWGLTIVL